MNKHTPMGCKCEEYSYNPDHDCYFCPECDLWLERQCDDPDCVYCVGRPGKPSQSKYGLTGPGE